MSNTSCAAMASAATPRTGPASITMRRAPPANIPGNTNNAAKSTAERHPQIEFGEPGRCRPLAIQLAMTQQRNQEEGHKIDGDHGQPKYLVASAKQSDRERRHQDRHEPDY